MTIKGRVANFFLNVIRGTLTGFDCWWATDFHGKIIYRFRGKITGGTIARRANGDPVGLTLVWEMPGHPVYPSRLLPLTGLRVVKGRGLVCLDGL